MKITRIKETCIYVSDLEKTKQFYHDMLELPLITIVQGRHVFFKAGECVLLCFLAEVTKKEKDLPPHGATGSIHFALEVETNEYDTAITKVKQSGINILHQHKWKAGLRSFYFHDPDNNLVEIIEQGVWEA